MSTKYLMILLTMEEKLNVSPVKVNCFRFTELARESDLRSAN